MQGMFAALIVPVSGSTTPAMEIATIASGAADERTSTSLMADIKASRSFKGVLTRPSEINADALRANAPLILEPPMSKQLIICL